MTRASHAAAALLLLACGARSTASTSRPAGTSGTTGVIPLARALVLQTSGPPPHDTSVTFQAGKPRTILLLHGPPDHLTFAELVFGPATFAGDSGRDVTVRVRARRGVYGLDLETSSAIGPGATVTFTYPRYFSAPPQARQVYGSDAAFERALSIGRLQSDSVLAFLTSTRPATDNLQAPLPAAGSYLVAASR